MCDSKLFFANKIKFTKLYYPKSNSLVKEIKILYSELMYDFTLQQLIFFASFFFVFPNMNFNSSKKSVRLLARTSIYFCALAKYLQIYLNSNVSTSYSLRFLISPCGRVSMQIHHARLTPLREDNGTRRKVHRQG